MIKSAKLDLISKALIDVQVHLKNSARDKQAYGYKYTDLATIIDSSKESLRANNLVVHQSVGGDSEIGEIKITTIILHESGQYLGDEFTLPKTEFKKDNVNNIQKMGSSITYGRRYALAAVLGIASDEDTDGKVETTQRQQPDNRPKPQITSNHFKTIEGMAKRCENQDQYFLMTDWADKNKAYLKGEEPNDVKKLFSDVCSKVGAF